MSEGPDGCFVLDSKDALLPAHPDGCTLASHAHKNSGLDFSTPWREDYEANRELLAGSLQATHPALVGAVRVWAKYSSLLLSNLTAAAAQMPRPAEPAALVAHIKTDIDKAEDRLSSG